MYHYIRKAAFYKNTYGKPFLVRIAFETILSCNCKLIADNICRCDSWFANNGNVEIKYDVVNSGDFKKSKVSIIRKSIVVDLKKPLEKNGFTKLVITNNAGLTDKVIVNYSDLVDDYIFTHKDKDIKLNQTL